MHRGNMGGNLPGKTTATGRVVTTQLKYQAKPSLNLVREFEVITPRVVPHNSNCKFFIALLELRFKKTGRAWDRLHSMKNVINAEKRRSALQGSIISTHVRSQCTCAVQNF